MASGPWRWLVLFFTRPMRVSDLSAIARWFKPRPQVVALPVPVPEAVPAAPIELPRPRPRPSPVRERPVRTADAGPSVVASMFRPELQIGVSEQPLDTLPAELRVELERPSSGRL